jgi:hypothetical protein
MLSKFVFMCEAIDTLDVRAFSAGRDGYKHVYLARSILPLKFAEGTAGVSPQHV